MALFAANLAVGFSATGGFPFGIAFATFMDKCKIMGLPQMVKLQGYKRFKYTPRHYDPDKEELEDRVRQIKQELGYELKRNSNRTTLKRGSFRQVRQQAKTKATKASNLRLVVILTLLLIIAYLIFFR